MEALEQWNKALDYLEAHLAGEVFYEEMARLACCSVYHLQRMFSYLIGMPLSEYVRRRRMTLAAFDLQNGERVMDVALKYGYESPTAFNRAFQAVHGISPSSARPGAALKAFPRISFQITIKGEAEMEYRIVEKQAFRVVGVRDPLHENAEESFARVPMFWGEAAARGDIPRVAALMNQEPMGILGICTCRPENNFYYICAATDRAVPEGMFEEEIPAYTWAVFPGEGPMPETMQNLQRRIVGEWLPTSDYEWANAPDIEVYLSDGADGKQKFEVWLPIRKK